LRISPTSFFPPSTLFPELPPFFPADHAKLLVHHVPDSHINCYVRYKLALTEDEPTIKPYDEAAWAALSDSKTTPIETSLCLLECLHTRWVDLMRGMSEADWARKFRHPERGTLALDVTAALYAWHGDHHVEHIRALRRRKAGIW
jgi:hypothetical protein